mgnify:FL=1
MEGDYAVNDNLTKLVYFLLWLEHDKPNTIYGSYKIGEVVDSLAAVMGVDTETLRCLINKETAE